MAKKHGLSNVVELMRRHLKHDESLNTVEVVADNLQDALLNASIQLSTPIARLEYEVLQEGQAGVLGVGKLPWKISVTALAKKVEAKAAEENKAASVDHSMAAPKIENREGNCYVHLSKEGKVLFKAVPALGNGKPATVRVAKDKLLARNIKEYDEEKVKEILREMENKFEIVGVYDRKATNDSLLSIEISPDEMTAVAVISPPGPDGADIDQEEITKALESLRVRYGILPEVLENIQNEPIYRKPIVVAKGEYARNGESTSVQLLFDIDERGKYLEKVATSTGNVDFKAVSTIRNVVQGQALATVVPAQMARVGYTVLGRMLPAEDGKELPLPLGHNVSLAPDKKTIIADTDGQVLYINGKINVERVYYVNGDVDIKTGHIEFLGTVIVSGSVDDGFSIKASGDVDIKGNVGQCNITAGGDVIVHLGINAKSQGTISAGKSIWSKFFENVTLVAGENIVGADGFLNTHSTANNKIICNGKRATILGGHLIATEEVISKNLGSAVGGAETIIEVGYDPKTKLRVEAIVARMTQIKEKLPELDQDLATLQRHRQQMRENFPDDKAEQLKKLLTDRAAMIEEARSLNKELEPLQQILLSLKGKGKIGASGTIYPRVRLTIRDVTEEIKSEVRNVTFYAEDGMLKSKKFEEPTDSFIKDGPPDLQKPKK